MISLFLDIDLEKYLIFDRWVKRMTLKLLKITIYNIICYYYKIEFDRLL